jgi:hypothetical protein
MTENEELCLLVGFKQLAFNDNPENPSGLWIAPDGTKGVLCPDLFSDLNALDKWVVPKLPDEIKSEISFITVGDQTGCYLGRKVFAFAPKYDFAAALASAALKFLREQ